MATKPFLSQIAVPVGTTTGDVYYPQTSLLMHFNGTNGSTTMTDNSKNVLVATATNGAAISTVQSKFGGSSVLFDGTNDYVSIPTSNFNTFGSSNFTVELFFRSNQNNQQYCSFISDEGGISSGLTILLNIASSSDGKIGVWQTGCVTGLTSTNGGYNDNNWHHIAYVRNGSIATIYVDGINQASTTVSGNPSTPAGAFIIGAATGLSRYYNGYIDELRITNGIARYTGNFTPSTTQFLDSAGDANSSVVVNSTATGFAIGTGGINGAQLAKAWVNFNGTGTVAITDSYNVSSITDLGTGQYLVNFSTPMNNVKYVNFITVNGNSDSPNNSFTGHIGNNSYSQTTTYAVIASRFNGSLYDNWGICSIVFSN